MFRNPLMLPILFDTEDSVQKRECGMDIKKSDCNVVESAFYSINGVLPHSSMDDCCVILSNGSEFLCTLDYEYVLFEIMQLQEEENLFKQININ